MHQFSAVFYELVHENNRKSILKAVGTVVALMVISLISTKEMFFTDYSSTFSAVLTIVLALFWVGIFNSITIICRIRPRIKVQVVQGLSLLCYISAHVAYQAIQCFLQAVIVTGMLAIASAFDIVKNIPTDGVALPFFVEYFIFAFCVILSADMLGLAISSVCKNEKSAMTVMPMILIIEMVLSNALFTLPEVFGVSAGWASFLMISRWGMDFLGTSCDIRSYCSLQEQSIKPLPTELPEILFTYSGAHMTTCVVALITLSFISIIAAFLFLRHIKKEQLL